jgi:hypothetical protein
MRKIVIALAATASILTAGSVLSQAQAAPATGIESMAKSASLVETVACWCGRYRCACGHPRYYGYGYRYRY